MNFSETANNIRMSADHTADIAISPNKKQQGGGGKEGKEKREKRRKREGEEHGRSSLPCIIAINS
jgi:hypothetical protein